MLRIMTLLLFSGWVAAACSPTFNWREVRAGDTGLKAVLPCKPDKGSRMVEMVGRQVSLEVVGCDTGGATFAVLSADIADPARSGQALAQWKSATLANMRGSATQERPFVPPGSHEIPQSLRVAARGQRQNGSNVESQAAYFARGSRVFQAVIYADAVKPEMSETFFSGLQLE
jgi:hypothetical protein